MKPVNLTLGATAALIISIVIGFAQEDEPRPAAGGAVEAVKAGAESGAAQERKDPFVKTEAAAATENVSPDVVALVEYFRVPAAMLENEEGEKLLEGEAVELRKAVQTRVEAGEAEALESGLVRSRSGQRAKIESIAEVIYPTEWDPAEEAGGLSFPTAFETRNTGHTLEIDPVAAADGMSIDINLAPEVVALTGSSDSAFATSRVRIEPDDLLVPEFETTKISISTRIESAGMQLIAVTTPTDESGALEHSARILTFLSAAAVSLPNDRAAAAEPGTPARIRFEWFETDAAAVSAWMLAHGVAGDGSALYEAVRSGALGGESKLLHHDAIRTRLGQRAKNESAQEMIYAISWNPPHTVPGETRIFTSSSPQSFETRMLGATTEVDPSMAGSMMQLNMAPGIVRHTGWRVHHRALVDGEWVPDAQSPEFYTMKVSSAVALVPSAEPTLVAMLMPPDEDGRNDLSRRVLVFVSADVF